MSKSPNLFPIADDPSRLARQRILGQKGATLWFTGLSGSGKTTIAQALERRLLSLGKLAYRLDGDTLRTGVTSDLGFSAADRAENIRRCGEICKLFADAGVIALASFISPYAQDRERLRSLHAAAALPFMEVFVDCSLAVAESRDPKGLYRKARAGEIPQFTGISAPYEAPIHADLHLHTDQQSLQDEVDALMRMIEWRGLLELAPTASAP